MYVHGSFQFKSIDPLPEKMPDVMLYRVLYGNAQLSDWPI